MSYKTGTASHPTKRTRPVDHEGFLFHPIATDDRLKSYENWEADHAGKRRFRVTGLGWLFRITRIAGLTPLRLALTGADDIIDENPKWKDIACRWSEPCSALQFDRARREAVYFSKAVKIIAASELLLADSIRRGEALGANDPREVYSKMKILPCCFNVDGFNEDAFQKLEKEDPVFVRSVLRACDQSDPQLISGIVNKKCLSRRTAFLIVAYLNQHHSGVRDWVVRAKPGGKLGTKAAVDDERIDESNAGELPRF